MKFCIKFYKLSKIFLSAFVQMKKTDHMKKTHYKHRQNSFHAAKLMHTFWNNLGFSFCKVPQLSP